MAKSGRKAGRQPIYGAAVPLKKPIKLDRDETYNVLRSLASEAGARVRMIDDAPRASGAGLLTGLRSRSTEFICEIAGVRLSIRAEARPLCTASVMHSFISPSTWHGSLRGLVEHRAHIMVSEAVADGGTNRDAMFDRATAVTLATAAIANLTEAEGVIWLPARNAVQMNMFGSEMERFIDGQAPLQFWLRCQTLPAPVQQELELGELSGEALQPGVATVGLSAFIGAEIIAPPSICNRDMMLDRVFALASAVIDENSELKDGAVYGQAGGVLVRLNKRKAGQYSERPYWELLPRPAPASNAALSQPDPDDGAGHDDTAGGELGALSGSRLRLVVPGR